MSYFFTVFELRFLCVGTKLSAFMVCFTSRHRRHDATPCTRNLHQQATHITDYCQKYFLDYLIDCQLLEKKPLLRRIYYLVCEKFPVKNELRIWETLISITKRVYPKNALGDSLRTSVSRWENVIKTYHKGVEWKCVGSVCLVQGRNQGKAVVNMVMILRVNRRREFFKFLIDYQLIANDSSAWSQLCGKHFKGCVLDVGNSQTSYHEIRQVSNPNCT